MTNRFAAILSLILAGCTAQTPNQHSLCDLPRGFPGWSGQDVRWQGLIVDASPHGLAFISEDCRRRGAPIRAFSRAAEAQYRTFRINRNSIWVRADLTAKIAGQSLIVSKFHRLEAVSDKAAYERTQALGF